MHCKSLCISKVIGVSMFTNLPSLSNISLKWRIYDFLKFCKRIAEAKPKGLKFQKIQGNFNLDIRIQDSVVQGQGFCFSLWTFEGQS